MKLILAVILVVALNGCAGIPNDYNFKSEATSGAVAVNSKLTSYDSKPIIAPYTVLTPAGTMLVVPNYSTGQIQAIIQISK